MNASEGLSLFLWFCLGLALVALGVVGVYILVGVVVQILARVVG